MSTHAVRSAVLLAAVSLVAACGDSTGPAARTADDLIAELTTLANDADRQGDPGSAAQLRASAEMIRAVGEITAIDVQIDGRTHRFYGFASQIVPPPCEAADPEVGCPWTPGGSRVLFAVRGRPIEQLLFAVGDLSGSNSFVPPDMVPGEEQPSIAFALFANRRTEQLWFATSGSLTTAIASRGEPCPLRLSQPEGIEFTCERGALDVALDLTAEGFLDERTPALRIRVAPHTVAALFVDITTLPPLGSPFPWPGAAARVMAPVP